MRAARICGAISAIMTGVVVCDSAPRWRKELGPFPGYEPNKPGHAARHAQPSPRGLWRGARATRSSAITPVPLDHADLPGQASRSRPPKRPGIGRSALGKTHGYRNAQSTVVAPTGTIGLVMDCDTTGIEPDFALVKFKKLAGGGYFKIINQAVPEALRYARLHAKARSPRSRPTRSVTARCSRRRRSTTRR